MNKDLTELVMILDCSGSMHGKEADTIGGFHAMLAKNRKGRGKVLVSTVCFNDEARVIDDRVPIERVKDLDEETYVTGGCTALLDAVGGSVHHIARLYQKLALHGAQPGHTMFVIMTDGMENASMKYSFTKVKQMIELEKEKYGWEFLFLGANIDAVQTAEKIGIDARRASNYCNDSSGIMTNFEAVSAAVMSMRGNGVVKDSWKESIEKDYRSRFPKK